LRILNLENSVEIGGEVAMKKATNMYRITTDYNIIEKYNHSKISGSIGDDKRYVKGIDNFYIG
jgi:hypothetical protein